MFKQKMYTSLHGKIGKRPKYPSIDEQKTKTLSMEHNNNQKSKEYNANTAYMGHEPQKHYVK